MANGKQTRRIVAGALIAAVVLTTAPLAAQSPYDPDPTVALNPENSVTKRTRELDEIGRWGGHDMVGEIRSALGDKSPEIRMATMRAIMRMGVDEARDDVATVLRGKLPGQEVPEGTAATDPAMKPSSREIAWAARAMGRSRQPAFAVPELIGALKYAEPGVRAAALSSLQRLTGITQGASREFLIPIQDSPSVDTLTAKWQDWWRQNEGFTPEQWRTTGLQSALPKDRASAARAIATAGQTSAIPQLVEALRFEGDPTNANGMSGVREALAQSLNNMTGLALDYQAYAPNGVADADWRKQHNEALDRYSGLYKTVTETGVSPLVALLDAPDGKSRLSGILKLRGRPYSEQPLKKYLALLSDTERGVAEHAWKNLTQATGVYWPFDPAADKEQRTVQLARWQDWMAEFENKRGEGVTSVFLRFEDWTWGRGAKVSEKARFDDTKRLHDMLPSIRSRAAEWIAVELTRERIERERAASAVSGAPVASPTEGGNAKAPAAPAPLLIAPTPLIDAFDEQNTYLQQILDGADPVSTGAASMLQRNLARAFAEMNCHEAVRGMTERLKIAAASRNSTRVGRIARAALETGDVLASVVAALGRLAPDGRRAEALIVDLLDANTGGVEVRVQAAYAVANLGMLGAMNALAQTLSADPVVKCRWAAAEALAMMAEQDRTVRAEVRQRLDAEAALIKTKPSKASDSDALRNKLMELSARLAAMKS